MRPLIAFFTARPVFATMVALIVILIGAFSISRIPQDLLPDIEFPVITVTVSYPNAGPEEVEELVVRPLERTLAGVPGVEEMTSSASEGSGTVSLSFVWGTDLSEASNDVRDRLDRVVNDLPEEASPPQLRKFDPNQRAIVLIGVASQLDPIPLRRLLDQQIQPRLEQVSGVAIVDTRGGLTREVRVEIDPDRLQAQNISLDALQRAIREANVLQPAGDLRQGQREILLRTPALINSTEDLRNIIIARRADAPIYLRDVAAVVDTHADISRIVRINQEPGVRLAVRKQSGANTVEAAQATAREVERINRDFPQLFLSVLEDRSVFIQSSLRNVVVAIGVGSLLAICVLIFFLRNWRSTFSIAVAIPISLIGTFILVYFQGMTLNLFTLGGLALGVGMMVDNSIVVIENIYRHRSEGKSLRDSAVIGASEVGSAIVASTLTTLAIFLPLLFLEGVTGTLFRQLAYVVAFSLLCSLFAALTVVPMLAGNLPEKMRMGKRAPLWSRLALGVQNGLQALYERLLERIFSFRPAFLSGILAAFFASFLIIPQLGVEFFPEGDEGQVRVNVDADQGVRIELLSEIAKGLEKRVVELVPELDNMDVDIGATAWRPGAGSTARLRLQLVSSTQRSRTSEEIALALQAALGDTPGVRIRSSAAGGAFNFRRLGIGGEDGERLTVEISGFDLATLDALTAQASALASEVRGVIGTRASRETGIPRLAVKIDRERAADLGFSVEQVARSIQTFVGGTRVGMLRGEAGDEVDIRMRLANARSLSPDSVLDLQIQNSEGRAVALRNFVTLEQETGASQIQRRNQQRTVALSLDVGGRDIGSIAEDLQDAFNTIPRDDTSQIIVRGDYEEQQRAFRDLMFSLILALLLVYMVMACLYESLRDPLLVMFSVPLAAGGALFALWITGSTLSVQSFIGFIMLVGIVVNNAILIVDQANRYRQKGMTSMEAAKQAGTVRFRPILMTMLTTVLALLPLAFGYGEGGEAQASLARVVVGGLLSSSLITLFVIPCLYPYFHREKKAVHSVG